MLEVKILSAFSNKNTDWIRLLQSKKMNTQVLFQVVNSLDFESCKILLSWLLTNPAPPALINALPIDKLITVSFDKNSDLSLVADKITTGLLDLSLEHISFTRYSARMTLTRLINKIIKSANCKNTQWNVVAFNGVIRPINWYIWNWLSQDKLAPPGYKFSSNTRDLKKYWTVDNDWKLSNHRAWWLKQLLDSHLIKKIETVIRQI